jgi:hypothetical protein
MDRGKRKVRKKRERMISSNRRKRRMGRNRRSSFSLSLREGRIMEEGSSNRMVRRSLIINIY